MFVKHIKYIVVILVIALSFYAHNIFAIDDGGKVMSANDFGQIERSAMIADVHNISEQLKVIKGDLEEIQRKSVNFDNGLVKFLARFTTETSDRIAKIEKKLNIAQISSDSSDRGDKDRIGNDENVIAAQIERAIVGENSIRGSFVGKVDGVKKIASTAANGNDMLMRKNQTNSGEKRNVNSEKSNIKYDDHIESGDDAKQINTIHNDDNHEMSSGERSIDALSSMKNGEDVSAEFVEIEKRYRAVYGMFQSTMSMNTDENTSIDERKYAMTRTRDALKKFIIDYPKINLASHASYWLGETYKYDKQYEEAALAYLRGYKQSPTGVLAPDNLFGLGESLMYLGRTHEACTTFAKLLNDFPNVVNSIKSAAERRSKSLGCDRKKMM